MNVLRLALGIGASVFCVVCAANSQQQESSPWIRADAREIQAHEQALLPVSSLRLSPGKLETRPLEMPGLPPFFLVGADDLSLSWLRARTPELKRLQATGLAVDVFNADDLARIRAAAPGLTIQPANGDHIARRLQIEHYPALVTSRSLEQ